MKNKFSGLCNSSISGSHLLLYLAILVLCSCDNSSKTSITKNCDPTLFDEIGPFYRPNAPLRNKVGSGYVVRGSVLSTNKCTPLARATLEFWLVNSKGEYDEDHRATVITDTNGRYTFESNRPTNYIGRLPHIHMKITAQEHEELITQYYPKEDEANVTFDIVLSPVSQ